jgi:hypothetical protein
VLLVRVEDAGGEFVVLEEALEGAAPLAGTLEVGLFDTTGGGTVEVLMDAVLADVVEEFSLLPDPPDPFWML